MPVYVALIRGINVAGKNRLLMADLRESLTGRGLSRVQTYIQSGNVVFVASRASASPLAKKIHASLLDEHDIDAAVLVITGDDLEMAIAGNPFRDAIDDPKSIHFFFLSKAVTSPDLDRLESLCGKTERYELRERVMFLHAPDGIGRSKLAAGAEKCLGVSVTARNYSTVRKLAELVADAS